MVAILSRSKCVDMNAACSLTVSVMPALSSISTTWLLPGNHCRLGRDTWSECWNLLWRGRHFLGLLAWMFWVAWTTNQTDWGSDIGKRFFYPEEFRRNIEQIFWIQIDFKINTVALVIIFIVTLEVYDWDLFYIVFRHSEINSFRCFK